MIKKSTLQGSLVSLLIFPFGVMYANNAPVESLTPVPDHAQLNQTQNQPASPTVTMDTGAATAQAPSATPPSDEPLIAPSTTPDDTSTQQPPTDNTPSSPPPPQDDMSTLPLDQRVARVEQQVSNLVQMNFPEQVTKLQETVRQLRGQIEVQAHQIKMLMQNQQPTSKKPTAPIVNDTNPVQSAPSPVQSNTLAERLKDTNTYNAAFNLLREKQLDAAKKAFAGYLKTFQSGQFRANAHYWLGEILMLQYQYSKSVDQFETVIRDFPKSTKVPDAKLKIAMIHLTLGKKAQARKEFKQLKRQYPGTTAAQLASIQLQQIVNGKP